MNEIYVLFICEVKDNFLSLTSAHSYYSSVEDAVEAKDFLSKLHNDPSFVYQVFKFPVL